MQRPRGTKMQDVIGNEKHGGFRISWFGKQEGKGDKTGKVGQAVLKMKNPWCSRLILSFQAPVRSRLFLRSHLWGLPNRMAESSFIEDATRPPLFCHAQFESLRICSEKNWIAEVSAPETVSHAQPGEKCLVHSHIKSKWKGACMPVSVPV